MSTGTITGTIDIGFVPDFVAYYKLDNGILAAHIIDNINGFERKVLGYNGDTNSPTIKISGTTLTGNGFYFAAKYS